MRISTVAGLMILTTVALSTTACTQSNLASVVDHSGRSYGWDKSSTNVIPLANNYYRPAAPVVVAPAQQEKEVAVIAPVQVESRELAAPKAAPKPEVTAAPEVQPQEEIFVTTNVGQLRWPVQGKVIRTFGAQQNGVKNEGINIATPYGMPIRAANNGEVAYVGNELKDFGNMLILRHADGSMTSYSHASEVIVKKGDKLQRGALLGYVGRSGNVGEPQLGFTMRVGDQTVDPLKHLPQQFASR